MPTLITMNKETFVEVCKEHNVKLVFLLKQTRKNYDLLTAQHEAKFTASYINNVVVFTIVSEAFNMENKEKAEKVTEEFERELQEAVSYMLNNGLSIREGVWVE